MKIKNCGKSIFNGAVVAKIGNLLRENLEFWKGLIKNKYPK